MKPRLPRWLMLTLIILIAVIVVTGIVLLWIYARTVGIIVTVILLLLIGVLAATVGPQLYRMYKFNKYFKAHESELTMLPNLLQSGRTQDALMRFEGVMKHAPDSAYIFYMRAFFLQAAGKLPEAMSATNKALSLVDKDPFLPAVLQQMGGQMGQPSTVPEFKRQLEELRRSLEPRVSTMRERHEKAVSKRKKKSR